MVFYLKLLKGIEMPGKLHESCTRWYCKYILQLLHTCRCHQKNPEQIHR
jgi:hypothetical protein